MTRIDILRHGSEQSTPEQKLWEITKEGQPRLRNWVGILTIRVRRMGSGGHVTQRATEELCRRFSKRMVAECAGSSTQMKGTGGQAHTMEGFELIESVAEYLALWDSEDPDDHDRAIHDEAPTEVWLEVIAAHPEFRALVAQNKTSPDEVLCALADDDDPDVRFWVAMRRAAGKNDSIARLLVSDANPRIRAAIARNPKLSVELLRELTRDDNEWVRTQALGHLTRRTT
ncbi:HEAT repeat domain-containing protein [Gordonia sp. C13]|uniref:HEAT repeat domain-containing protein n=1 Tax=Gordonia sp. C13 TaxID=2935078 RepID=UPI00200B0583|nr:HEAT repeat domain-containing protein [Gordonia sp. C13]MCK8615418.1 HEAT repeat domain-containing protein [Gordonia sp. C13]